MAKYDPPEIVPLVLQRWDDEFTGLNYAINLGNPFEITTPLSAIQQEAGAKGMGVIVMVSLVPLESIYGMPPQEGDPENVSESKPE